MLLTTIMLMFEIGKFREDFVTYRRTLPDDSTMKLGRVQVTFVLAKYSEKDFLNDSIVNLCNTYPQTKNPLRQRTVCKGKHDSLHSFHFEQSIVVKLMKSCYPLPSLPLAVVDMTVSVGQQNLSLSKKILPLASSSELQF